MHETALAILFWSILVFGVLTLTYPWSFRRRVSRVLVHLPLLLFVLWRLYEYLMPVEMNIRIDMFFLLPVLVLSGAAYVVKLWLMLGRSNNRA